MKKILLLAAFIVSLFGGTYAQIVRTVVGATRYDLQTNNSIQRRVVVEPSSGKVSICYTGSLDSDPGSGAFASRGTGYYHFNGTGVPSTLDTFLGRQETKRVGWPNPLHLAGGKEAIITHISDGGFNGLYMIKRNAIGTGAWTESGITNGTETWPRVANSGDSIFVISSLFTGGTLPNGMTGSGGLGFKRSFDGGTTWTPLASSGLDTIPGAGLLKYPNATGGNALGGDQYALDVKGKRIAILTGTRDVTLFISNDFGNTWTSRNLIISDNNLATSQAIDNRSSGDYSVLIDNNDKIHCFWGRSNGDGLSYNQPSSGIMYWNENFASTEKPRVLYQTAYQKEPGTHSFLYLPYYTSILFTTANNAQNAYGATHTCQPSSGIDASGNLYLSYMRMRGISDTNRFNADKQTDVKGNFMNDVYLMKSTDGGATWIGPLNVSSTDSLEESYPSIARHVDANVHMVYQQDALYGTAVGGDGTAESHVGVTTRNRILYARVPTADIIAVTDITPPVLSTRDSLEEKFGITRIGDTIRMYRNCATILNSSITMPAKVLDFVKQHFVTAYDNVSPEDQIVALDTPDGVKFGVAGLYRLRIYAKDLSGNTSQFYGGNTPNGVAIGSRDTILFHIRIINNDLTPPTITVTNKVAYVKKGASYTLPAGNFTTSDDNPCGSASTTAPSLDSVNLNTSGRYRLNYVAKDIAGNTAVDSMIIYVGEVPIPKITDYLVTAPPNSKVNAKSETSQFIDGFFKDVYKWTTRRKNSTGTGSTLVNVPSIGTSKVLSYNITSSTLAFDTLCLEISNDFNAGFGEAPKRSCVFLKSSVSINAVNLVDAQVTIYPNPASEGKFDIRFEGIVKAKEATVIITDMSGRTILNDQFKIVDKKVTIDESKLSKGLYMINTEAGRGRSSNILEIK
jgi:hypothetical protein